MKATKHFECHHRGTPLAPLPANGVQCPELPVTLLDSLSLANSRVVHLTVQRQVLAKASSCL